MSAARDAIAIAISVGLWACTVSSGCGRSSLEIASLGAGSQNSEADGSLDDTGTEPAPDGSSGGGSGGSTTGGSSGAGTNLTCVDSTTCAGGQVCCLTLNLSGGLSTTSECHAAPCAPGAYQLCSSAAECPDGDACNPNPLGMGPKICVSALDGGVDGGGAASPPSCRVPGPGRTNCGNGGESCCTSLEVAGGTYDRAYDNDGGGPTGGFYAATLSGFRLDKYEVTVGRFRQFVAAWSGGYRPLAGSGKHVHLNGGQGLTNGGQGLAVDGSPGAYEIGWLTPDNGNIAPTTANLTSCGTSIVTPPTWTDTVGSQENQPIDCVNWYEAYAFCVWDGGFLPSEAEWEYAAAGGGQQREYPWGSAAPGTSSQYAIYGCYYPSGARTCTGMYIAPVGTATLGTGRWGQLDLVGNMSQWLLDTFGQYSTPCSDCASLTTFLPYRVERGGWAFSDASSLLLRSRVYEDPTFRTAGVRCARTP